jgi:hypothetical protein
MRKINSNELHITGYWLFEDNSAVEDVNCQRIHWLVNDYLVKIRADYTGWRTLYLDPGDNRLWELFYPKGEMENGGPPSLRCLSEKEALRQFPL